MVTIKAAHRIELRPPSGWGRFLRAWRGANLGRTLQALMLSGAALSRLAATASALRSELPVEVLKDSHLRFLSGRYCDAFAPRALVRF